MDQMELKTESKWLVDTAQTVILPMKKGKKALWHPNSLIYSENANIFSFFDTSC